MASRAEAMKWKGPDLDTELAVGNKEPWSNLNQNVLHSSPVIAQPARV
jgi:hypothetical protein